MSKIYVIFANTFTNETNRKTNNMEIKFRGKVEIGVKKPFWIVGDLVRFNEKSCIHSLDENGYHRYTVNSETVGQFTGFTDKAGREIFGGQHIGDFVEVDGENIQTKHEVYFDETEGQWKIDESFYRNKAVGHPLFQALKDFDYYIINEK